MGVSNKGAGCENGLLEGFQTLLRNPINFFSKTFQRQEKNPLDTNAFSHPLAHSVALDDFAILMMGFLNNCWRASVRTSSMIRSATIRSET